MNRNYSCIQFCLV